MQEALMFLILIAAIVIGSPIAVLLILSAMSDWSSAEDWERSEHNAEIRHQELLEATRKRNKSHPVKETRRRFIKDRHGNILAEEYIVESEDYDDEEE